MRYLAHPLNRAHLRQRNRNLFQLHVRATKAHLELLALSCSEPAMASLPQQLLPLSASTATSWLSYFGEVRSRLRAYVCRQGECGSPASPTCSSMKVDFICSSGCFSRAAGHF